MGLFDFLKMEPDIKGEIGYYGLSDWWLSEFTDEERNHIVSVYTPMGSGQDILLKDNIDWSSSSVVKFLQILAGWFDNKNDRGLAIRILKKAEELLNDEIPILDIHFFYHQLIKVHYSNRLIDPNSFDKSIKECEQQIGIALQVARAFKKEYNDNFLPAHTGYGQLVIVKEKEQKYQEVIDLCAKALKEGWNGDWEHRIERCKKKLNQ
jgi:hypothetical protein